jgi:hypothetical protein
MPTQTTLTWTAHTAVCLECKRSFRVSRETLETYSLHDIVWCLECVTGDPCPGERPAEEESSSAL